MKTKVEHTHYLSRYKYIFAAVVLTIFDIRPNFVKGQTLEGGEILIDAGIGFGVHGLNTNEQDRESSGGIPGLLNAGIAYNILPNLALGIGYERNGYITDPDSSTQAVSNNLGLGIYYHAFNKNDVVLDLGLIIGTSSFRFEDFRDQNLIESQGSQFKFMVGFKRYFNEYLGISFSFGIPIYSYKTFKDGDGNTYEIYDYDGIGWPIADSKRNFELDMYGLNLNLGLTVKL